ncbi:hypothetical protein QEH42_gp239 [Microbacterium phage Pumpernickel]|uniref:Uncharacterized protein n=1 Tax=Microbacterium phage Pumpernickel TaxID=2885983 RepID=A0AAE9C3J5_9CAUD|nr:hypothetical protein QEH42_gp239 [Microbacterium phage Pumpernickel]UDL15979.1 hypothetical protein SEA_PUMPERNICKEL_229 [Microbacterium phage Pumpernickel]
MARYSITSSDEFQGASILLSDGTVKTVASDHPRYAELVTYLTSNVTHDESHIVALAEPIQAAAEKLTSLTSRISREGSALLFDGEGIEGEFVEHILKLLDQKGEDSDWLSYVRFLERLQNNPSKKSRKHLGAFVLTHGLSITSDGMLVAYKGVSSDGRSVHSGFGIVNGRTYANDRLPNEVGSVIEIPRHMVDDDRSVACSTGLHVGTYDYASAFASRLLTALVDPADVVSVPFDHSDAKVRVAKYTVKEVAPAQAYEGLTVSFEVGEADGEVTPLSEDGYREEYNYYLEDKQADPEFYEGLKDLTFEEAKALIDAHGDEDWFEHIPEVDSAEAAEIAKVDEGPAKDSSKGAPVADPFRQKVDDFKALIPQIIAGGWNKKLSTWKNKKVTVGQREAFQKAIDELGLE